MRRKPMHGGGRQNNNGGHGGHGGGQRRGGGGNNNNRPRKNYPQLREKYLNQAKDALSSGDRVMAEYYFQHADHCYRMMVEDGWKPREHHQDNGQQDQPQVDGQQAEAAPSAEESMPDANALPSFLTMGYTAAAGTSNTEQAAANPNQGQWEEN